MKQVAKLVIIDDTNHYLLLKRSDHPTFGDDPDLPGGTVEMGETGFEAMLREVVEEIGVAIDPKEVEELYEGAEYSTHQTVYSLYLARVSSRPEVTISWEHASYEWLTRAEFLKQAAAANDNYMHMTHDTISRLVK